MNINKTDHFLLAQSEPPRRHTVAKLEWATIALTMAMVLVVVVGVGSLMV